MAKLIYKYGTMNSGKSLELIKTVLNYNMAGKVCLAYTSEKDTRSGKNIIASRNGMRLSAETVTDNMYKDIDAINCENRVSCIVVDECQFLEPKYIDMLSDIVDDFTIPVICFGLLTDFKGNLFPASKRLIELSDTSEMNKTICVCCEKKATMNIRTVNGKAVYDGEQIQVGDNEYFPVCRKCYKNFDENFSKVKMNNNLDKILI